MKDENADAQKSVFEETNDFKSKGGLKSIGKAMDRGVTLVLSLWDDPVTRMLWLDSDYPLGHDRSKAGVQRGPCSTDSGSPDVLEND